MHIVIGVLALLGGAYFWIQRMKGAAEMTQDLAGVAGDVMAAARRLGFRRKYNQHPVEAVDDPNLAIAAAGLAFLELAGLPSTEQHNGLVVSLQNHLNLPHDKAQESLILGRWLLTESGGPEPGLARLTRRLYKLNGMESFQSLMSVLKDVASAGNGGISDKQREALADITRLYRIK